MFMTSTADPLSGFLMTISGFSLSVLKPLCSSLMRLSCFLCLGLLLSISCLRDL